MTRRTHEGPIGAAEFASCFQDLEDVAGPVLLAVSGGPDSTALLHAAASWARTRSTPRLAVATVDHTIRSASRAEAEAVAARCAALGVPHALLTWRRGTAGHVSSDAARRARYDLLTRHARSLAATHLLTGHTLDDQAETILIRMAAGSGLTGLGGMRRTVWRGGLRHVRPFLSFPKSRLVATCRAEGWDYVEDPSNRDCAYARPRWRRLASRLAEAGLDAGRLARLAARLQRAEDALERATDVALERCVSPPRSGVHRLDMGSLAQESEEIALRVLSRTVLSVPVASGVIPGPLRLERLEVCLGALVEASRVGARLRRTLAGRLLSLDGERRLEITPEPVRSRGRSPAVTVPAAGAPHSLGIEGPRA